MTFKLMMNRDYRDIITDMQLIDYCRVHIYLSHTYMLKVQSTFIVIPVLRLDDNGMIRLVGPVGPVRPVRQQALSM